MWGREKREKERQEREREKGQRRGREREGRNEHNFFFVYTCLFSFIVSICLTPN